MIPGPREDAVGRASEVGSLRPTFNTTLRAFMYPIGAGHEASDHTLIEPLDSTRAHPSQYRSGDFGRVTPQL